MDLLLPFTEYCELSHYTEQEKNIYIKKKQPRPPGFRLESDLDALRTKALFIANPSQMNVIRCLLYQCNADMIVELMNYFDKAAPIQKMLTQRLDELDRENRYVSMIS